MVLWSVTAIAPSAELERARDEVGHAASRSPASGRCACGSRTGSAAPDRARAAAGGAAASSSRAPRRARPRRRRRPPTPRRQGARAAARRPAARPAQAATSAGCPSCAIRPFTSCSTPYEPGLPATATIGMPHAAASRAISGLPWRAAMKMLAPRRAAARAAGVDASGSRTRPASAAGTSERIAAVPAERSSAISAVVGSQLVEQRPQRSRVAERGLDRDERRRRRDRAGEARPVDGETGDGGLEPEPLQDGLGRRGRDGRDDVGAGREPLGAASAAQRRPAAEEGRDDRRRRLAQRDGARPGLVGVEHVDGVEAAAHEREPHAGGDGHRNRDAAGGGARRDGQAEADRDHQRHARRGRQGGGVSPGRARSRRRPSSSSAGLRAGARMTTSWPRWASARASADQ